MCVVVCTEKDSFVPFRDFDDDEAMTELTDHHKESKLSFMKMGDSCFFFRSQRFVIQSLPKARKFSKNRLEEGFYFHFRLVLQILMLTNSTRDVNLAMEKVHFIPCFPMIGIFALKMLQWSADFFGKISRFSDSRVSGYSIIPRAADFNKLLSKNYSMCPVI